MTKIQVCACSHPSSGIIDVPPINILRYLNDRSLLGQLFGVNDPCRCFAVERVEAATVHTDILLAILLLSTKPCGGEAVLSPKVLQPRPFIGEFWVNVGVASYCRFWFDKQSRSGEDSCVQRFKLATQSPGQAFLLVSAQQSCRPALCQQGLWQRMKRHCVPFSKRHMDLPGNTTKAGVQTAPSRIGTVSL